MLEILPLFANLYYSTIQNSRRCIKLFKYFKSIFHKFLCKTEMCECLNFFHILCLAIRRICVFFFLKNQFLVSFVIYAYLGLVGLKIIYVFQKYLIQIICGCYLFCNVYFVYQMLDFISN